MRCAALVSHLEVLRPERKFVMVFTEGWPLYRPDEPSRGSTNQVPPATRSASIREPAACASRVPPIRHGRHRRRSNPAIASVTMLAYSDHEFEFRELLQRANRANVSFYPIDARGLVVFDTPIEWGVPPRRCGVAARSL